ncbi:unnamed protein product [Calypogeia fissa]
MEERVTNDSQHALIHAWLPDMLGQSPQFPKAERGWKPSCEFSLAKSSQVLSHEELILATEMCSKGQKGEDLTVGKSC